MRNDVCVDVSDISGVLPNRNLQRLMTSRIDQSSSTTHSTTKTSTTSTTIIMKQNKQWVYLINRCCHRRKLQHTAKQYTLTRHILLLTIIIRRRPWLIPNITKTTRKITLTYLHDTRRKPPKLCSSIQYCLRNVETEIEGRRILTLYCEDAWTKWNDIWFWNV